ncbi:MAG: TerD family protein [Clostridiales bacterium]|nr:TerD family protein [Clostridiales bacterium]
MSKGWDQKMFDIPNNVRQGIDLDTITSLNRISKNGLQQNTHWKSNQSSAAVQQRPVQNNTGLRQPNNNVKWTHTEQNESSLILKKGQKVKLEVPENRCLDLIDIGFGWSLEPNGKGYDLDVEAFLLGDNGKVIGDDWFVFYNQKLSPDGSVTYHGDGKMREGSSDIETIQIKLSRVDSKVDRIVFIVTINEALENGYNFSNVSDVYIRVVDKSLNKELIRFYLTDYYATVCSMVVGELYKYNNQWKFSAIGNGMAQDLSELCMIYGVDVG